MNRLARLLITLSFLLALPSLVAAQQVRLIGGTMCDTLQQIDALFSGIVAAKGKPNDVLEQINKKAGLAACGPLRMNAKFAFMDIVLTHTIRVEGKTWYFYKGKAIGLALPTGQSRSFSAPITQHWILPKPIDPKDKQSGA